MPSDALLQAIAAVPDFPSPGILFRDVTPLLARPDLLAEAADHLAAPFREAGITKVAAVEARGFLLGGLLAERLGAGLVPIRKAGKLPRETLSETYELEYGTDTLEAHADAFADDDRVLFHDDVLATGGTAAAALRLIGPSGAHVVGAALLIELAALEGRKALPEGLDLHAVLQL